MASQSSAAETPTPTETPEGTPSPSAPEGINKFNWLQARAAQNRRANPFVKSRPSLNRESSTAELFSRENSSSDFFQSSRLNLFETTAAPKPEGQSRGFIKVIFSPFYLLLNFELTL